MARIEVPALCPDLTNAPNNLVFDKVTVPLALRAISTFIAHDGVGFLDKV